MQVLSDVAVLRWPDDAPRRARLTKARTPRLLVVAAGMDAPAPDDCLEDWVPEGTTQQELDARMAALGVRARMHEILDEPTLDDQGVLRVGPQWVALPPVERRLVAALLANLGRVCTREDLSSAGWPDGSPGRNALDVHVLRLRRRLAAVGLSIRTVRSRGYVLERTVRAG